ncbi:TrmB family transcriptional regulator [Halorarum halophilum]|uniref:TrmB family transcriptional regulator n=1 Tax=Halorarum halophilum TaxID=2743090 RepID=A0A7D5GY29_9EURY|nr:helix-turn-helix domain-containing protein [Halobaculum halophilum]QLG26553.1 TrmB family transcriptional regulator [Halobaculum halophilum]
MAPRDDELVEAELVDHLKALGFKEYEAHTLIALFRLGTATAKDIADSSDVPRTRVYDAIDPLHESGLVDIQYASPKKFTVLSRESLVRKLNTDRENMITEVAELFEQLGSVEPQTEQMGVWTVTGRGSVAERVFEFIDEADDEIIYMTIDDLFTDDHLDRLQDADERGVDIHLAGISDEVQGRIQDVIPSADLFETLWEWEDTPAGSLLITDEQTALVSVRVDDQPADEGEESAIWASGARNSLVVVLRAIFTWRLRTNEMP